MATKGRAKASRVLRFGAWAVGLGFAVLVVIRVGPSSVLSTLLSVGPRLSWLIAAYLLSTTVMALPWRLLLPSSARPSLPGTVASRFAASGLNAVLPFVGAGEASRLLWLPPLARAAGGAALIADRLTFAVASLIVLVAAGAATWFLEQPPAGLRLAVGVAAVVFAVLLAGAAWTARQGRVASVVGRLIQRSLNRLRRRVPTADDTGAPGVGASVDAHLQRLFAQPGRLAVATLIHVAARALAVGEIYLALRALDVAVLPAEVMVLAAVPVALALVGAVVPGQVGLVEGTQAAVAGALGLGASAGLAVVLLQRARQVLFLPVTAALLASRSHPESPPTRAADDPSAVAAENPPA